MRTVKNVIFLPDDRTHFEWDEIEKMCPDAVTYDAWTIAETFRSLEYDFDGKTYAIVAGNDKTTIGDDPRTLEQILHDKTVERLGWD